MTAALPKPAKSGQTTAPQSAQAAALPTPEASTETRVLLEGVSWETYERLLVETGESRNQRFAYDNGILEVMVPLPDHEEPTRLFDDFVAVFVDALGIELRKLGSLTMKKAEQRKGLEPDCCFYIQNEAAVRGLKKLDFDIHPPPDLVVEIDNSSGSLDKFPIYVALRVPEIWRLWGGVLRIYLLNGEQTGYGESEQSLAFPQMPVRELPLWIGQAREVGQRAALRELAAQVRENLG